MFTKSSRYYSIEEAEYEDATGRIVRYKKTRYIPATAVERRHVLTDGERLDHLAYRYFRDPERFWRIADANFALWPDDLVAQPGRTLGIPAATER